MSITEPRARKPVDIGVPGPTPGEMGKAFWSVRADPLAFLDRARRQWGDVVAFPVPGPPVLEINDPADVRHVLQTAARHWGKQTVQYRALARVTGPGLLASAEPDWISHRRTAAPAFHHQRLESVTDQVRDTIDGCVTAWSRAHQPAGTVVDVAPLAMRIGLDVVGRALFSADLSGQAQRVLDTSSRAARLVVRSGRSILPLPAWLPTPLKASLRRTRRQLDATSYELIERRRTVGHAPGDPGGTGDDLLGLLVDSGMPDEQIRSELVTMIIAGHETVAASLAWTLMLLAQHQPAQDRVRAELAAQAGPAGMLDHRSRLPWTRAVLDEALRLYPPAWVVSRRSDRPDVIGGVATPAGTTVIISPWLLHRDEALWPEPLAFRPERFLDDDADRGAYLPFGQGPRLCIGREFALGEMVMVLERLLSTHHLGVPDDWTPPRAAVQVAVHPRGGMPLVVTPLAGRTP